MVKGLRIGENGLILLSKILFDIVLQISHKRQQDQSFGKGESHEIKASQSRFWNCCCGFIWTGNTSRHTNWTNCHDRDKGSNLPPCQKHQIRQKTNWCFGSSYSCISAQGVEMTLREKIIVFLALSLVSAIMEICALKEVLWLNQH